MRSRFQTSINSLAFTGASQVLWTGDPRRRGVCLFIQSGYTLWLGFTNPAVVNVGLPLSNQTYPYIFDWDRFGDLCTKTVFGITTSAGNGGILEIFDNEDVQEITKQMQSNFTDPGNGVPEDFAAVPYSAIGRLPYVGNDHFGT